MLINLETMRGDVIRATDGDVGHVKDFYFDDERWVIRYLVVETGSWLQSRRVLISPYSLGTPDHAEHALPASISKEQVRASPDVDTERPVSRQHELDYMAHYGYPEYWGGMGLWGGEAYPGSMMSGMGAVPVALDAETEKRIADAEAERHRRDDPHLRSCQAVTGYHLRATDGEIGHVSGWIVDDESWAIRYAIAETSQWWLGHQVLIALPWIRDVSWAEKTVAVDLTRQAIKESPPYDAAIVLARQHELSLHSHYGRPGYW